MDYKYELLEKTTIVRTNNNKMLDIIEEVMKDPSISLDYKWECLEYYPHIEDHDKVPDFDLDVFQRFNTDYDILEEELHSGISEHRESDIDTIGWNYITATISLLQDSRKPIPGKIMYAYDLLKLVEDLMNNGNLIFTKEYEDIDTNDEGDEIYIDKEEIITFTKTDLKKAKEYIINKRLFKFKYKVDHNCS